MKSSKSGGITTGITSGRSYILARSGPYSYRRSWRVGWRTSTQNQISELPMTYSNRIWLTAKKSLLKLYSFYIPIELEIALVDGGFNVSSIKGLIPSIVWGIIVGRWVSTSSRWIPFDYTRMSRSALETTRRTTHSHSVLTLLQHLKVIVAHKVLKIIEAFRASTGVINVLKPKTRYSRVRGIIREHLANPTD